MSSPLTDEETTSDEQTDDAPSDCKPCVDLIELDSDTENDDNAMPRDLGGPPYVVKPFLCPVCRSGFSSKKAMARHVKKHPEVAPSPYRCLICDRQFCDSSEFVAHARTHERVEDGDHRNGTGLKLLAEETKKEDDDCDKDGGRLAMNILPLPVSAYHATDFAQESLQPLYLFQTQTLQIKTEPGLAVREMPGPFADAGADQAASGGKSGDLVVQLETGTGQKPYKCPCCAKCFSLTKTLLRHMKIHSEDRVYRCRVCGRRFCQKSDLVNHTRVHTGEKPYSCQECHKAFAQKGNLVVHMRTHLEENHNPPQNANHGFTAGTSLSL